MRRRDFITTAGVLAMTGLAGCVEDTGPEAESGASGSKGSDARVEILSQESGVTQYGTPYIEGRAKNMTSQELSYAEIQVRFYDSTEARVGSGLANISNLGSGVVWEFEAMCVDCPDPSKIDSYQIEVTTSF